jgi:hypothetical protein
LAPWDEVKGQGYRNSRDVIPLCSNPEAEMRSPRVSLVLNPTDGPITFIAVPPAGLTGTQLTFTTTMPGFVLVRYAAAARDAALSLTSAN